MAYQDVGAFNIGILGIDQLASLPERAARHFHKALLITMPIAADAVIRNAQQQLVPGHGYDTGTLRDSLTKDLVNLGMGAGVIYTLGSDAADYWLAVEFGHMLRDGTFWEGYHFMENALNRTRPLIFKQAYVAWRMAALQLDLESRTMLRSKIRA